MLTACAWGFSFPQASWWALSMRVGREPCDSLWPTLAWPAGYLRPLGVPLGQGPLDRCGDLRMETLEPKGYR